MSQLERTCSQLVGKTNIIRDVLDRNDARALCNETLVAEMRADYVTDRPLYVSKLDQLQVPEVLLNFHFHSVDDVTQALHDVKLFVQHSRQTRTHGDDERFVQLRTPVATSAASSDVITVRSRHSMSCDVITHPSPQTPFDPYPKSIATLVGEPLQASVLFEYDVNVRHVTYMHDEVWTVLSTGTVLVIDPEHGKVKRKVKVRERERRASWWSRWLSEDHDVIYDCLNLVRGCAGDIVCLARASQNVKQSGSETEDSAHLLMIDCEGAVQNKMATGSYVDVTIDDRTLFALISSSGAGLCHKVDVFKSDGAKGSSYLHMKTITLETSRVYFRILASAGVVYVTGLRHEVHKYHVDTEQRYTHGKHGSLRAGELDMPKLCCVDDYGVLVVADSQNHRLQVLDRQKQWQVLDADGESLTCPWDADWDSVGGRLFFVSTHRNGKNLLNVVQCKERPRSVLRD